MIKEALFEIGQFSKPHGIKGEISLVTRYDLADIDCEDPFLVCYMDGIPVPFFIDSYRQKSHTGTLVGFAGIDSGDKAKLLIGKTAYIPSDMLPRFGDNVAEWNFILGYTVSDEKSGKIGQVTDVYDDTLNVLLKVDYNGEEILVPAALITVVDRERKTIDVSLPDGFWEI
jgi:16S rRNA processing protein RimM